MSKAPEQIYEKTIQQAIGSNVQAYFEKLSSLQNTWRQKVNEDYGNGVETRLVADIVLHKASPVNTALIADNLEYFQTHAKTERNYKNKLIYDPELHLARACLLGSRQIAEFLLFQELKSNYTDNRYDYILGYVCQSMNEQWMKDIANLMNQAKIAMPLSVYSAPYQIIFVMEELFKAKH